MTEDRFVGAGQHPLFLVYALCILQLRIIDQGAGKTDFSRAYVENTVKQTQ